MIRRALPVLLVLMFFALLGFAPDRRASSGEVAYVSTSWSSTSTTASTVTGLSFTPEPGGVYRVEYTLSIAASVSTESATVSIAPGNASSGAADMRIRASSATTATIYNGPISAASTGGTASPTTPGDRFEAVGFVIFTAHATAPTAFSIQGAAETGGANSISIAAGEGLMIVRRLR